MHPCMYYKRQKRTVIYTREYLSVYRFVSTAVRYLLLRNCNLWRAVQRKHRIEYIFLINAQRVQYYQVGLERDPVRIVRALFSQEQVCGKNTT